MATPVRTIFRNPASKPAAAFYEYDPDQLIAGDMKRNTSTVMITGGALLRRGTVLGKTMTGMGSTIVPAPANVGNGTVTGVTFGPDAKEGNYEIRFTGPTAYTVTNPDNDNIVTGSAAGASPASTEIRFTFTAGGTAMGATDKIAIVSAANAAAYRKAVATADDGSDKPCAILVDDADASAGDVQSGVYDTGQFNINEIIYDPSFTQQLLIDLMRPAIYIKKSSEAVEPT